MKKLEAEGSHIDIGLEGASLRVALELGLVGADSHIGPTVRAKKPLDMHNGGLSI